MFIENRLLHTLLWRPLMEAASLMKHLRWLNFGVLPSVVNREATNNFYVFINLFFITPLIEDQSQL